MICIYCHHPNTDVKNSRPHKKTASVWRRRHCTQCGQSFTTDELPRFQAIYTVTTGDISESFNRGILLTSIAEAFRHDPSKGRAAAWDLSETIINQLTTDDTLSIDAETLRSTCRDVIYRYDRAAGTQYAIAHQLPF